MKKSYFTIIFLLILKMCFAQTWEQSYTPDTASGGQGFAYEVVQTQDGGYLMAGQLDLPTGAIRNYIQLMKTDNQGNELWRKLLGTTYGDVRLDEVHGIYEVADGGFIVGGSTHYNHQGLYIVRTDAVGDTVWTKVHNPIGINQIMTAYSKLGNEEFLSLGRTDSLLIMYRTDTLGNITLHKNLDDYFIPLDIDELSNGDYIITGMKEGAYHLVRTNTQGDTLWTKSLYNASISVGTAVQGLPNGGFLVGGYTVGFAGQSASLARYDDNGNEIWQVFLSAFPSGTAQVSDIVLDANGNYLATGSLTRNLWSPLSNDGFVIAISPTGQTLWTDTLNNTISAEGASIISSSGNCYVVAGGSLQGYYLKNNCGATSTFTQSEFGLHITVSPNPATNFVQFEIEGEVFQTLNLKLFDGTGRVVRDVSMNQQYRLERQGLPDGLYYYGIFDNNQLVNKGKVIFGN